MKHDVVLENFSKKNRIRVLYIYNMFCYFSIIYIQLNKLDKNIMDEENFRGIINDDTSLSAICASFEKSKIIALDSEYIRESTYYPQPSLVQISDGTVHVLLDILAFRNLRPLKELLAQPNITKVIHSCEQDLMLLEHIKCPIEQSLFDTQLAASFLGLGYMISYQNLVKESLGIKLKKGYARSDWLTRPLSEKQINYAIEDVKYLRRLRDLLNQQLQESGKLEWFEEENERVLRDYYAHGFERATPRVAGAGKVVYPHEKKRLRKLIEWREEKAKEINIPRRWLVRDDVLIAVARNQMSLSALSVVCKDYIDIDMDDLGTRLQCTEPVFYDVNPISRQDKKLIEKIKLVVSQTAKDHEIEQPLIASHKQIVKFVRDKKNRKNMALSSGWRSRIIQPPIQQLIDDDDD